MSPVHHDQRTHMASRQGITERGYYMNQEILFSLLSLQSNWKIFIWTATKFIRSPEKISARRMTEGDDSMYLKRKLGKNKKQDKNFPSAIMICLLALFPRHVKFS